MNHLLSKIGSYPFEKLNLLHRDIKPSKEVINLSIGEPKLNADSKVLDILNKETNSFSNYPPMNAVPELSDCLLYTSPSPRDAESSRMPSSA